MNNANDKANLMQLQENTKNKINALPIGQFMNISSIKNRINSMMGSERGLRFITGVTSAVTTNPSLAECTNESIFNAALLGETLNLSPSPQLGQYFLVPYKKKDKTGKVISITAQFQLGYKGYIQLAIRSGQYKKINVAEIKEGEFVGYNFLDEEINITPITSYEERKKAATVGYYAMFEYTNGFKKSLYMSKEEMLDHADTYSSAFNKIAYQNLLDGKIPEKELYKYSSFWYKNFDEMAKKTMLRQLISKWGIMSIEMQTAFESDMAEIKEDGTPEYIDNQEEPVPIVQSDPTIDAKFEESSKKSMINNDTQSVRKVTLDELRNNK